MITTEEHQNLLKAIKFAESCVTQAAAHPGQKTAWLSIARRQLSKSFDIIDEEVNRLDESHEWKKAIKDEFGR